MFRNMSEIMRRRIMILCFVPVVLILVGLLFICIEPLSVYVYNCYFEGLVLAVFWILFWSLIFVWKKLSDSHPINRGILLIVLAVTMLITFPYAMNIAKGRYFFYKYGLYRVSHSDIEQLMSAFEAFENKDWESVQQHLNSCSTSSLEFFSYSTGCLRDKLDMIEKSKSNFKIIIDNYEMNPSVLALYASMAEDFGGTFKEEFLKAKQDVKSKIDSIDTLYDAIHIKDSDLCKELIGRYGNFWFEKQTQKMILDSDNCIPTLEQIVIKDDNGQQYKTMLEYAWGL